jgi:hypothetical protein
MTAKQTSSLIQNDLDAWEYKCPTIKRLGFVIRPIAQKSEEACSCSTKRNQVEKGSLDHSIVGTRQ